MPIHDWTRVDAGLFHHFHQSWIVELCRSLNGGVLPPGYFALAEQTVRGPIPDVLALRLAGKTAFIEPPDDGGIAIATTPPRTKIMKRSEGDIYLTKASRVTVRHRHGKVIAVIEIVSPGNKGSVAELRTFVEKTCDLIVQGVHVLVIDLFPPSKRDPRGIHKVIWDQFQDDDFELPPEKPLVVASYDADVDRTAYVEMVGVGDVLPDMPLFLRPGIYVPTPLESSYQAAWNDFPDAVKGLLAESNEKT